VIAWQHRHPFLASARVRRALTLAINRPELLRVLNVPPDVSVLDAPFTVRQLRRGELPAPLPYDQATASALLDGAGWRPGGSEGLRERNGMPFVFDAVVSAEPPFPAIAVYVQDQLRRVGVGMEIRILERLGGAVESPRVGAAFMAMAGAPLNFRRNFVGPDSAFGSGFGYTNRALLELIDRAIATPDSEAQDQIYREMGAVFQRDVPVTFLSPRLMTTFAHRRIRGLAAPWRGDLVRSMEDLWLED
jgi:ABC-type transport system substrate-binding protein